ncbi:MAG: hypothetical protein K2N95_04070 [Lachnospiraceae bacterium]|nr:hypothetical protein [Lachnospiraceae bacterium]
MQPYQEEYIANLRDIAVLATRSNLDCHSFDTYLDTLLHNRSLTENKIDRNIELLRDELFPLLDRLFEADSDELTELEEFAQKLLDGKNELDGGLFCQIYQALLSRARHTKDRNAIIRCLYWLGIGRHNICNKMVGLDWPDIEYYMSQMRLCFAEAAAYLKYYDAIDDIETKGYILRSRANTSLGQFKSASSKIRLTRQTLALLQDEEFQQKTPELPWDRYIYMTHQQMTSSISYNRENDMTAQDVTAIMESAHIVHKRRIHEAISNREVPPMRSAFSCYAIEYYCGLLTLEELLGRMEELMDLADTSSFSCDAMYTVISLPAIYCKYLREYPEQLSGREKYLESLYRKIVRYTESFPKNEADGMIFFYLRQLATTYIETANSISYGEFQQTMLIHFAPDIYVHSQVVGKTAAAFCEIIMNEEPAFFDDIEYIRKISNSDAKREAVLDLAMNSGVFHDVGKINFINLFTRTSRQWFEEEYEITHLHTVVGSARLNACVSTRRYAAAALGHHSWYDGSRGYPESYKRLECPYRQMVDVIGLIDWMDNSMTYAWLYGHTKKNFDEAIQEAIALEGKRFSPLLTTRLRDKAVTEALRQAFEAARHEAYRQLYRKTAPRGKSPQDIIKL